MSVLRLSHRVAIPIRRIMSTALCCVLLGSTPVVAQLSLTPLDDMVLDSNALVLATGGNFSRVINGSPFQQENLITHGDYQYAAWYRNGANDEDLMVSRRRLGTSSWRTIDTGRGLVNGDATSTRPGAIWNSHNVASLGISSDGRIHLSYDQHNQRFRYLATARGVANLPDSQWNSSVFRNAQGGSLERSSFNPGGPNVPLVTYPRFTNIGDDMVLTYREFGSGSGDVRIVEYDTSSGRWSTPRYVNRGRTTSSFNSGVYDDAEQNRSTRRNAYHNGFHADQNGRLHTTWTWREGTQDGNRDINYAYSDDRGRTWRNNDGQLVGNSSFSITSDSPGIEIADLDRRQAILNQQGQIVDLDGGVHALMFHRLQDREYDNASFSDRSNSAYHHYYRDPLTGEWEVNLLTDQPVGSRPRLGVDSNGNLFALYVERNDLVIAGAQRTAIGYSDWEVLLRDDDRNYEGTPLIDNTRLLDEGILSIYIQERAPTRSETEPTGSPLRVIEFSVNSLVAVPEPGCFAALLAASAFGLRRRRRSR